MNKLLTKIVGVALGLTMAIGVGVAVASNSEAAPVHAADSTVTWSQTTALPGTATSVSGHSDITFKISSTNSYTSPLRFYANVTMTIAALNGASITSVKYSASSTGNYVTYAQDATVSPSVTPTVSNKDVTWTFTSGATQFTFKPSTQTRATGVTVTYTASSTTEATGISFSPSSVTVSGGLSGSFTPTLTGGSGNYEKTISWSSSNTTVLPNPANSEDGEVVNFTTTNPASNTTVTLTASVVSPGKSNIGSITITVNHVAEHTITYDANGGTGSMSDSINLVSANGFTAPAGMEFKEWNTSDDGTGESYDPGDIVSDDTDLYAIWQKLRYTTGFESSEGFTATQTYNTTKVDGPTGKQWQFVNGTASSGNVITDEQSAQLRKYKDTSGNPNINMQFNIDEIHSISFEAKAGNAGMGVEVFYSTNNGSSWTSIGTETVGTSVVSVEKEISSYVSSGRFKIEYTGDNPSSSNRWMSIDDIIIETQSATPTVTSVSLTPNDDTTLKVGNSETYTVDITGNNLTGNETVDVVLTDDLGDYVSIDNSTGLEDGDTFTVTATAADGIGELYISYNSGAVDSSHILIMTEEAKTLSSISVHASGTTSYFAGSTFSASGFEIYANYTDETSENVTASSIFELMRSGSPVSISTPLLTTDTTVRASYTELGSTEMTNITITVISDYVTNISWTGTTAAHFKAFSGSQLTAAQVGAWSVVPTFAGAGEQSALSFGQYTLKVGNKTIASLPYTWASEDDGQELSITYGKDENGDDFVKKNNNAVGNICATINAIDHSETISGDIEKTATMTKDAAIAIHTASGVGTSAGVAVDHDIDTNIHITGDKGSHQSSFPLFWKDGLRVYVGNTLTISPQNGAVITSISLTSSNATCSAASGSSPWSITSGGDDDIVITIATKTTPITSSIVVEYTISGSETTTVHYANDMDHFEAQKAVVKYAKAFNTAMNASNVCSGTFENLETGWANASSAYTTFLSDISSLDASEQAWAKNMLANATAEWSTDAETACVEKAMATYEHVVRTYKLTPFMSEVRSVANASKITPLSFINGNGNTAAIIVIISMISVACIGGYFFLRKRKEQ